MLTLADIRGPAGPFELSVLLGRHTEAPRWQTVQWVKDTAEGLRAASHMCSTYSYRLYLGPDDGYLYLEWVDDTEDADLCIPKWVRK